MNGARSRFPDPRRARGDVIAIGDDLSPATLVDAYHHGIFPWPMEGTPLPWFSPRRRAVLEFDSIHISRSLARARKQSPLRFSIDEDFAGVIAGCSDALRPGQDGTWIFPEVIYAYCELHRMGHAHSAEVWEGEDLVGGIYGVDAGGVFGGESMFYRRPNASKLVLLHLVEHLAARGATWLDIQVMTPHMAALGARLIPRAEFLKRLEEEQATARTLFS